MRDVCDNWERLVAAVLILNETTSPTTSSLSSSSDFSFSHLDDLPFAFSSPNWSASHQHFPTKTRKKNLTIQVPKPDIVDLSRAPVCSEYCSIVSPRVNRDYAKQESYPLPLPPTQNSNSKHVSPPKSAAKLPSPKGAENVKSPKTSWKKGKLIGKGPLGNVYLAFNSEKGQMCAMKEVILSPEDTESKQNARLLENEIALLSRINHPNIVKYYGSEMVADTFYTYFEYVSGGPVNMILQQYGRLGESVIINYTQQILSGLAYLHSKSIAHRDIKGANVLVDPNGKVKLCNFAFEHIAEQSRMSWFMDSFYWMAPEFIMNSNERKLAIDIWSLGCTVLEMATARPPLSQYDRGVAMSKIANHEELPQIPDHLSDVCKDFVRHCLQWNPQQRATASQLLDHPFVKSLWPLGKQILVSTNVAKSEGSEHARSPHELDSGKVIVSGASKSPIPNFQTSNINTPRYISAPVSPVGSPLSDPRSATVSPVGSPLPLPDPRSASVSPVRSPLPHQRSAPVSPVGSPLPLPLPHPRSAPISPVGSPLPHPRSTPISPVGSPLPHPRSTPVSPTRSPQHLNRQMPPKSNPHTMINGVEAIPHSHLNQSSLPKTNTPSYWDPNILRAVFKFS